MTLYARAHRGRIFHVAPWTLSQGFDGWPPALCGFHPKRWGKSLSDPQQAPVCDACRSRAEAAGR